MPFFETQHVIHAISCRHATEHDRVKAVLSDGSYIVFRLRPELADGYEWVHPGHERLHLDRELTPPEIVEAFEAMAFEELTFRLPRKLKKRADPSMINFFVWADNYQTWAGGPDGFGQHRFEVVCWLQIPGEPENYYPCTPEHLDVSLVDVEFITLPHQERM